MKFTRGDTYKFKFYRLDVNNNIIEYAATEIWFTVKTDYTTPKIAIQKKLSTGEITFDPTDFSYHVVIEPQDTANFIYDKNYVYDIQVLQGDVIKTIAKGILKVDKEVTFERGV